MDKIKSLDDLRTLREAAGAIVRSRRQGEEGAQAGCDGASGGCTLLVCGGTGCKASQSALIAERLKDALTEKGLEDTVQVVTT
ncbi:MAG: (2Fe-2S) ferredoxin domain-containing protein, partial [Bacteroidales bacterium]|nr:(2Fe-2S) ferredoxin domain-containing protein [Bacteroidales bacterium]